MVSEWTLVNGQLDPNGYRELFRVGMPVFDHPIKDLAFGPDEMLYITHGDGSVQSATAGGGQANNALGKILRIDPTPSGGLEYTVPSDNPFVGDATIVDEAWSIGHRNPHTLSFTEDGTLLVGEVGRDNIDEINLITKGGNFGWAEREGTFVHLASGGIIDGVAPLPPNDASFGYSYPVAQYGHEGSVGAGFVGQAIAGGFAVENGSPLDGEYLYAEFATIGDIYHVSMSDVKSAVTQGNPEDLTQATPARATIFFDHDNNQSTAPLLRGSMVDVVNDAPTWDGEDRADTRFGKGPEGEIYLTSKHNGMVYLVTSTLPGGPGGFTGEATVPVPLDAIQVESGDVTGRAVASDEHSGFTGTAAVADLIGEGSAVTGLIAVQQAEGAAEMTIRYAAGPDGPGGVRTVGVVVNGALQQQAEFVSTGSWSTWATTTVTLELEAGSNVIDFVVTGDDTGWVNLDAIWGFDAAGVVTQDQQVPANAIQAEDGELVGRTTVSEQHEGFSGAGMVQELIGAGSGVTSLVALQESAGSVDMTVRYAAGVEGPSGVRTLSVLVNGEEQVQASFANTGGWSTWSTTTVTLDLDAGNNLIDFVVTADDTGWVNLDAIWGFDAAGVVTQDQQVPANAIQAEDGELVGRTTVSEQHEGFSGAGMVQELIGAGSGVTSLVALQESAGSVDMTVRYAAGVEGPSGVRTLSVLVNGEEQVQASFANTGGWSTWSTTTVTLDLDAGNNLIDFVVTADDTGWVNLDAIWGFDAAGVPEGAIEAEGGEVAGRATVSSQHQGFSGTGMVQEFIGEGSGVTDLLVLQQTAGTVSMTIRYAAGVEGPSGVRTLSVRVNGEDQAQASFANTGAWDIWSTTTVVVELSAGANEIALLVGENDTGWVNVDSLWGFDSQQLLASNFSLLSESSNGDTIDDDGAAVVQPGLGCAVSRVGGASLPSLAWILGLFVALAFTRRRAV